MKRTLTKLSGIALVMLFATTAVAQQMICAELTDDFLGTNGRFSEHFVGLRPPFTREAPSHFVWRDRHYMFTSGTTGYVPNSSKVAVFDDYHGEYTDLGDPCLDDKFEDTFGSQITSVIKIPGKNLYVALADRWLLGCPVRCTNFSSLS